MIFIEDYYIYFVIKQKKHFHTFGLVDITEKFLRILWI